MKASLFFFLFLPLFGFAQTASISGTITDDEDAYLAFATVILYQNDLIITGARTDDDGKYKLSDIQPGTYDMVIKYLTKAEKITGMVVGADQNIIVNKQIVLNSCIIICEFFYFPPVFQDFYGPSGMTLKADEIRRIAY